MEDNRTQMRISRNHRHCCLPHRDHAAAAATFLYSEWEEELLGDGRREGLLHADPSVAAWVVQNGYRLGSIKERRG